jgi:subtilisin family serine protease
MKTIVCGALAVIGMLSAAPSGWAQESKSAPLAKQLAAALDAGKLDSVAAKDPSAADVFFAALYFPGSQLLVVSAKYSVPQLLSDRLLKKEYRDTYLDLNGAGAPDSKIFIQDGAADGLKVKSADNQAPDIYEAAGKQTIFDGDSKRQKMSDQDYQKVFSAADDHYSQILTALLAQVKKSS